VFNRAGVSYQGNDIKIKNLEEQHVTMESKRIFGLCYRDDKYSSFVVNDHQKCCDMNGRHGKIISYDSLRLQYIVSITSNDSKQAEGYITALPPSVMEPTRVFLKRKNHSSYQLSRHENQPSRPSEIQLKLPNPSYLEPISIRQVKEVKCLFFYDIFEFVRRIHVHPEQVANGTSKALLLTELEKAENRHAEENAKISIARQDFERSYKRMASTHLNRKRDGPTKRARVFESYSTDVRKDQLHAVYKARYEHSIAMMKTHSESSLSEDYFTMPFVVSDKSLHTSGIGSREFDLLERNETALSSIDEIIHTGFSHEEPVVITSQSFKSLSPGNEIDDSVCNLCLKW
jgi:hypothetical protein